MQPFLFVSIAQLTTQSGCVSPLPLRPPFPPAANRLVHVPPVQSDSFLSSSLSLSSLSLSLSPLHFPDLWLGAARAFHCAQNAVFSLVAATAPKKRSSSSNTTSFRQCTGRSPPHPHFSAAFSSTQQRRPAPWGTPSRSRTRRSTSTSRPSSAGSRLAESRSPLTWPPPLGPPSLSLFPAVACFLSLAQRAPCPASCPHFFLPFARLAAHPPLPACKFGSHPPTTAAAARHAAGTQRVVNAIKAIAPKVAFDLAADVLAGFDDVRWRLLFARDCASTLGFAFGPISSYTHQPMNSAPPSRFPHPSFSARPGRTSSAASPMAPASRWETLFS